MVVFYFLLALAIVFALWLFLIAPSGRRSAKLDDLCRQRYAHRGLHSIERGIPENSIAAFRLAKEQGYAIELDLHLSRDGKLVVEHDDTLLRTTGSPFTIEESDWATLSTLRLEGTEERLPLLEEVLELIDGKVALLLEAKVVGGNSIALADAIALALQNYQGPFCVESFDPRPLARLRKVAPSILRGQLAAYVRKDGAKVSRLTEFALSNLLVHALSRPDFIAYSYKDRKNLSLRLCRAFFRPPLFFWTIRDESAKEIAKKNGATPIFEKISY